MPRSQRRSQRARYAAGFGEWLDKLEERKVEFVARATDSIAIFNRTRADLFISDWYRPDPSVTRTSRNPLMISAFGRVLCPALIAVTFLLRCSAQAPSTAVVTLGSRPEMFVDDFLIDTRTNVSLQLQTPMRREVVLTLDKPWEGVHSAYFTVFQEEPGEGKLRRIRMYYRGAVPADNSDQQVCCYAESTNGVDFVRPELGLYQYNGSKRNNIVYRGTAAHNFAPFLDRNPHALSEQKY